MLTTNCVFPKVGPRVRFSINIDREESIRDRAFSVFCKRHGTEGDGRDLEDWHKAEILHEQNVAELKATISLQAKIIAREKGWLEDSEHVQQRATLEVLGLLL